MDSDIYTKAKYLGGVPSQLNLSLAPLYLNLGFCVSSQVATFHEHIAAQRNILFRKYFHDRTQCQLNIKQLRSPPHLLVTRLAMAMNVIRLAADIIHLGSIALLLLKIRASKNCAGEERVGVGRGLG